VYVQFGLVYPKSELHCQHVRSKGCEMGSYYCRLSPGGIILAQSVLSPADQFRTQDERLRAKIEALRI